MHIQIRVTWLGRNPHIRRFGPYKRNADAEEQLSDNGWENKPKAYCWLAKDKDGRNMMAEVIDNSCEPRKRLPRNAE